MTARDIPSSTQFMWPYRAYFVKQSHSPRRLPAAGRPARCKIWSKPPLLESIEAEHNDSQYHQREMPRDTMLKVLADQHFLTQVPAECRSEGWSTCIRISLRLLSLMQAAGVCDWKRSYSTPTVVGLIARYWSFDAVIRRSLDLFQRRALPRRKTCSSAVFEFSSAASENISTLLCVHSSIRSD